jgi:hypothetical protein
VTPTSLIDRLKVFYLGSILAAWLSGLSIFRPGRRPAQPVKASRPSSCPDSVHEIKHAELIKAKSFTIDGEAVVLGPEGLSGFEELCRREAARTAILYAFDLIEHDGEDLRNLPLLDRKAAPGSTVAQY